MTAPTWRPAEAPPPLHNAPAKRGYGGSEYRPARPVPPPDTVPPQPWPPPNGDPCICMLREMNGRDITTKCGKLLRLKKDETQSDQATIWHTQVTCEHCLVRMG